MKTLVETMHDIQPLVVVHWHGMRSGLVLLCAHWGLHISILVLLACAYLCVYLTGLFWLQPHINSENALLLYAPPNMTTEQIVARKTELQALAGVQKATILSASDLLVALRIKDNNQLTLLRTVTAGVFVLTLDQATQTAQLAERIQQAYGDMNIDLPPNIATTQQVLSIDASVWFLLSGLLVTLLACLHLYTLLQTARSRLQITPRLSFGYCSFFIHVGAIVIVYVGAPNIFAHLPAIINVGQTDVQSIDLWYKILFVVLLYLYTHSISKIIATIVPSGE